MPRTYSYFLRCAFTCTLILGLAYFICAQAVPPHQVFQAHAREVMVDMVVTKKNGQTIQHLRARQVRLFDNGTLQKIRSFHQVSRSVTLPEPLRLAQRGHGLFRLPKINLIALVFDPLGQYQTILTRRSVQTFIKKNLQPYDYVAVFAVYHQIFMLQPFTNRGRRILAAANEALNSRRTGNQYKKYADNSATITLHYAHVLNGTQGPLDASHASQFTGDIGIDSAIAAFDHDNAVMLREQRTWEQLPSLLTLIHGLSLAHGRKEMIYFTQSLAVDSNSSFVYRHIIRSANRHHVSIYIVDPNGPGGDQQITQNYTAQSLAMATHGFGSSFNVRYSNPLAVMRGLADNTGGHVIADTNDLAPGLARIAHDITFHYELTYAPSHPTPGLHHIRVVIPRHGNWRIDARKEYFITTQHVAPAYSFEPRILQFPGNPYKPRLWLVERIAARQRLPGILSDTVTVRDVTGAVIQTLHRDWPVPGTSVRWMTPLRLSPGIYTIQTRLHASGRADLVARQSFVLPALPPEAPRLSSVVLVRRIQRDAPQQPEIRPLGPWQFHDYQIEPHAGVPHYAQAGKNIGFYMVAYVPNFLDYKNPVFKPHLILHLYCNGDSYQSSNIHLEPPDSRGRIPVLVILPETMFRPGHYLARFKLWLDGHTAQSRTQFIMQ